MNNRLLGWKIYQAAIIGFFLFGNIYWDWGAGGLGAGVAGAMVAWMSSMIIARIIWNMGLGPRFGIEGEPVVQLLYQPSDALPVQRQEQPDPADRP